MTNAACRARLVAYRDGVESRESLLEALRRCVQAQQALVRLLTAIGVPDRDLASVIAALDQVEAEIRELSRSPTRETVAPG
jgi:hypothetical protein